MPADPTPTPLTDAERVQLADAYRSHLPHGRGPGQWPACYSHAIALDHNPGHVVEVLAPVVERIIAARLAAAAPDVEESG